MAAHAHPPDWWRPEPTVAPQPQAADDPDLLTSQSADVLPFLDRLPRPAWAGRIQTPGAVAVAVIALAAVGMLAARRRAPDSPAPTGTLIVDSNPAGAQIRIDGKARGATPATMTLPAGKHTIELSRAEGAPRSLEVNVAAGTQVSQYIELPTGRATTGRLSIRTSPRGARVSVDGVARGAAPVTVDDLAPGEHAVVVAARDGEPVKQTVTVEAGATASLVVPLAASGAERTFGWVAVSAPFELQLYENGRLLGSSQSERIMVAAGSHQIEIVNKALGYRATRTVQVAPGKAAAIPIKLPAGSIAANAVPWADVWLDGDEVGETPIGNLSATIGTHELVFRHPDFGEQRRTVTVTATAPLRVSVDLRKK